MVRVHDSLDERSASGSIVNVSGPPVTDSRCTPLSVHDSENAPGASVTSSLKVTARFAARATPAAPAAGVVLDTVGGVSTAPHGVSADALFRGAGVTTAKSAALLSESVQASVRCAAVAF